MSEPIKVTVSDPQTGEVLDTRILDNDFMVICAGDKYLDGVSKYANGTQVLTVRRHTAEDESDDGR